MSMAVRGYLRYGVSYQDVEELLAERGITLHHVTVYRWVQRFTQKFIEAAQLGLQGVAAAPAAREPGSEDQPVEFLSGVKGAGWP
jgi:hypothetical protein